MKTLSISIFCLLLSTAFAWGKDFETFDGQFYNGLYYPRVDVIEWGEQYGEQPHMEFHLYSKERQVELSAVPGDKNGKPVLWLMYDLKFRGEHVCRHVVAPRQFKQGMKVYVYKDSSDPDYNNIYVSSEPMKDKKLVEYTMPQYQRCIDENASNMPEDGGAARSTASVPAPVSPTVQPSAEKKEGKGVGIDYNNASVPFSF